MEIENPISMGCQSSPTLPVWSKTGKRTRATHHRGGPTTTCDGVRESENLPPKKRKLDQYSCINGKEYEEQQQHKCNICSRAFSSYQALGGHKAHHNKASAVGEDDEVAVQGGGAVHRCPFCDKVFSKGQALGGHRRHCQRSNIINQENNNVMLSFDLNEFPPEEELGSSS